jgi:hypothetical protein
MDATATETLLGERHRTHGSFKQNAIIAQGLKGLFRAQPGWAT